jgi:hypothetical protein
VGNVEKLNLFTLSGLELQPLDLVARSQFIYRMRYPGSRLSLNNLKKMACIVQKVKWKGMGRFLFDIILGQTV